MNTIKIREDIDPILDKLNNGEDIEDAECMLLLNVCMEEINRIGEILKKILLPQ